MQGWISLWSLGPNHSRNDLATLAEVGMVGAEVWAEHPQALTHLKWLANEGLAIGLHLPFHDLNLANADPVIANHTLDQWTTWVSHLRDAGGLHAVVHGGYALAAEEGPAARARVQERLAAFVTTARAMGVTILLENQCPDRLGYTHPIASDLNEWLEFLKSTGAQACLDVGHLAVMGPSLREGLTRLGGFLGTVHYSDNDGQADRHWWPGDGIGIARDFWQLAEQIGFTGPVIYEINPYRYSVTDIVQRLRIAGWRQ